MLAIGTKAPDFCLPDQDGKVVQLSDFLGRKVVLYFYPKDDTPGCTRQACAFKSAYNSFRQADITVIGISKDDEESHKQFAEKYELPFILLADPALQAIKAYEVWVEKVHDGETGMGVERSTYIIDENGIIEKVFEKANPDTNAQDIMAYLGK